MPTMPAATAIETQRANAILAGLGYPAAPGAIAILVAWQRCEGGEAQSYGHNPMSSTWTMPGSTPLPNNPYNVQLYATEASGIQATVNTLRNGYYPQLLASLASASPIRFVAASAELSKWGTSPSCPAKILRDSGWLSATTTPPPGGGSKTLTVKPGIPLPPTWMLAVGLGGLVTGGVAAAVVFRPAWFAGLRQGLGMAR